MSRAEGNVRSPLPGSGGGPKRPRAQTMKENPISEVNCAEKCGQVITDCMKDGRSKDQCQILYRQCVSECVFSTYPYA